MIRYQVLRVHILNNMFLEHRRQKLSVLQIVKYEVERGDVQRTMFKTYMFYQKKKKKN